MIALAILTAVMCVEPGLAFAPTEEMARPPRDSKPLRTARKLLPPRFVMHETTRFVVLSDADRMWTRQQTERLERTHHQFQRFARRHQLDPEPLQHKLVCILFSDRAEYQTFARTHDSIGEVWMSGYYSPQHDWVVFYHADSNPSVEAARAQLREMQVEITELKRNAEHARRRGNRDEALRLNSEAARYRDHVRQQSARVDAFASDVTVATTTHEAVHQLLFHSGVQSPLIEYPVWISEGLATSFETSDVRGAFGPDHDYEARRQRFDELQAEDALLPLEALVVMSRLPDRDERTIDVVYHQSYALVTWLARYRRTELGHYLEAMRRETPGRPTPTRHRELFEASFGDIATLERAWLRAVRSR